ncbi:flagellar biosynthetic protein FliO [sulfur-oxidizing endosymbiont of Gigantopelta aegis]|uniref:flagellar biosynthetic protein FliO n=1 Tax=sulfur-oxidizing endosymbiont of Gigantopelta aegis TaxID=2794934 RepID=UPI001BE43EB2|nr:flagellar biosynthetic protein FliO [sulfur-oxidizing endosymbiont of Gigantopelta aegis]
MIFSLSQPLLAETKVESNIENDTALQKQQENTPLTISETDDKGFSGLSKSIFPANTINNSQSTTITNSSKALDVSLGLIFILILIMALAWFMKKMGYSNLTGQGQLKIIASLNLGQKEKIALIQVGKQQLLIGMTAQQINTLHVLDEMLEESEFPNNKASSIGNNAFARAFAQIKAANLKQ